MLGCSSSAWCPDCNKSVAIQSLNYQPAATYASGSPITLVLPNPGGGTPVHYVVTTGTLPAGLTLDPVTGTLSGTPTVPGVYTVTVQASNEANAVTQTFSLVVLPAAALTVAYATPQEFPAGSAIPTQAPTLANVTPGLSTTFSVLAGQLPAGLLLNEDGRITGVPAVPAAATTFTIQAKNGTRSSITDVAYTVTPAESLVVNYATPRVFPVDFPITAQMPTISNVTPGIPVGFALSAGIIPPGLTLNPDGSLSGTPAATGLFPFSVTVTNGTRVSTARVSYTITPAAPLSLGYNTPQNFLQGHVILAQIAAMANVTPGIPVTFSMSAGTLPPGLALKPDGSISGTPTTDGSFTFAVTAVNGTRSANAPITYFVAADGIAILDYPTPMTFTEGIAIPSQVPYFFDEEVELDGTYAISAGALPPGLTLNPDGSITGTPTAPGVYTFTVRGITSDDFATASVSYTVTPPQPLTIAYTTPRIFAQGSAIAPQTPVLKQETPGIPTTFALTGGTLPTGLTLNADGSITGAPSVTGVFPFSITATNGSRSSSAQISFTITPSAALTLSYPNPQTYTLTHAIPTQSPTVTQETPGITTTFALSVGTLPGGLTLNSDGTITGTPSATGAFSFTITATNGQRSANAAISYTVVANGTFTVNYTTPATFSTGTPIPAQAPVLTHETAGITTLFNVTSGTPPPGLTLNADGTLTGTPTTPGVYAFAVMATNDARTADAPISYTVASASALTATYVTPQTFTQNTSIAAQGPTVAYATPGITTTFAWTSGTWPVGLTLANDGTITGTPTTPGVYPFTITATNGGRSADAPISYTVTPDSALTVVYSSPQAFTQGAAIATQSPIVTFDTPGLTTIFAFAGGTWPTGLILNADGTITGSPSASGVFTFTVTATNGARTATSTPTYTVIPSAALTVSYATPPVFTSGTAIATQTPTVTQNTPGLTTTFGFTSGTWPTGLTLNADGTITGTPTVPGVYTFTVTATNGSRTATSTPTYTVTPSAALTVGYISPRVFPSGSAIATQTPTVTQETPGITTAFAFTGGTWPTGLTLNVDGSITGTPTTPGVYTFTVTATNGNRTATSAPTCTVTPSAALTVSYTTPQVFTSGAAIATQTPTVTQNTPGLTTTFGFTSGSWPTGLTLNVDGTITGTPSVPGVFTFTVTATNGSRTATSTPTYTVTPAAALTVSYLTPKIFTPNFAIPTQMPTLTNATPGVSTTYALASGSLPNGLTLTGSDGSITGTPTVNGASNFTVTATNGTRPATTSTLSYTIGIAAPTALNYTTPVSYVEKSAITPNLPNPSGGSPTAYSTSVGSLPPGLLLDGVTGVISGTPTGPTVGVVTLTIKGTNSALPAGVPQIVSITVTPAAPQTLGYSSPVTYTNGTAIANNSPNPTGGTPTSYQIVAGILPSGLSIDPTTGIISGTPSAATSGAVSITIRGSNATGSTTQVLSITVNDAAPTALNYTTPNTYVNGTPIQVNNPNPTGGTPTSYIVTVGTLPAGLTLDPSTGVISGKPTAKTAGTPPGPVSVTIKGTNGSGNVIQSITITVNDAAPTALHYTTPVSYILSTNPSSPTYITPNLPNPEGGVPTGYSITAGTLPTGLSLDGTTGIISGAPTVQTPGTPPGPVSVTIKGTNASGNVSQTIAITVPVPIVVTFSGNPVLLSVGQKAQLAAVFAGGTGSVDQGIGTIQSGANVYTPAMATPQSVTYTLTVTNGIPAQNVTATVTIQWITPTAALSVPISLSSGGGIDYTGSGYFSDPFYGFKIAIPAQGAVCQDTTLTVIKEASLPIGSSAVISASIVQLSSVFNLTTGIGYPFQKPATVTLPYDPTLIDVNDVPVAFYWDPTYANASPSMPGKWVANGIKSFDRTAKLVTFTTLLPGRYVVIGVNGLSAAATSANISSAATTGFTYNVDGWYQPNQGVFDLPGGSSFGMSAFASWYFTDRKASNNNAGLYTLFRQGPIASDDVAAKALISRLANGTMESWSQIVDQSTYQLTDAQTGLALITALKVTGQPQIFLMGEARPVIDNALAAVITAYDNTTKKFSVMDPNYPGTALTITWNPAINAATGGWSGYDRKDGYFPTFSYYAMEGHTSIHRLVDYERAFQGANSTWPNPPFASINLAHIGNLTNPTLNGTTLKISDASSVHLDGTITNGDETATNIYWNQNGGARTAVQITGGNVFSFNIGNLVDPYGTRVMLETTTNPCDPTFAHSGFLEFYVKDQALKPWFANSCFEEGMQAGNMQPVGWTTEVGSNAGTVLYPATPTWNAQGVMNSYAPGWAAPTVATALSALVGVGNDPYVTSIPRVLDGTSAFRVNHVLKGAKISRVYQTLTVPTVIAHPQLSFYWAAVLEDAGHTSDQQPYVDVLIQDVTDPNNVTNIYYKHFYAGDSSYPGWISGLAGPGSGSITKGIPWQKVSLPNLTSLKGHKLKITVTAADCNPSGHGGWAYVDNISCN
jgi:hypothetical protein